MNKLKIYLINSFYSSLIGGIIVIITTFINKENTISLTTLLLCMILSALLGSITIFVLINVIIRFKMKLFMGILSNLVIVAFFYIFPDGIRYNLTRLCSFAIFETLSIVLTILWYRKMTLYNRILKKKQQPLIMDITESQKEFDTFDK